MKINDVFIIKCGMTCQVKEINDSKTEFMIRVIRGNGLPESKGEIPNSDGFTWESFRVGSAGWYNESGQFLRKHMNKECILDKITYKIIPTVLPLP